jgi:EAL domain-containing protein (putative c-di-GMP-specific phosphodiesterase class I)
MTGNPTVESAVSALELGALRYLVKPVSGTTLLPAVAQALALVRLTRLRRAALETLGGETRFQGDRAGLETVFARATGSLWMAYQPVFYTADGRAFGHEALLRCSSPDISHAGAFLDVAERLGRTRELGRRVRAAVARDLEGLSGGAVLVNLHPLDLADPLLGSDADPLTQHASRVILEVTERASLESVQGLADTIAQLRGRGFRIAIDDLGAGYAALAAFVSLQPDIVKLDMSLVRDVHLHVTRRKLVASMTHLCQDLGMTVVGEGVESVGERDTLKELGCDLLQGFLLGRPVPSSRPRVAPGQ